MAKNHKNFKHKIFWQALGLGFLVLQAVHSHRKEKKREQRLNEKRVQKGFPEENSPK